MNTREEISQTVELYIECVNKEEIDRIPLADDVQFQGSMLPETLQGADEVRTHLSHIAPFFNMELKHLTIEGESAAAMVEIETLNGLKILGASFLKIPEGKVYYRRSFFDTHLLFTGQN
jgi:hypothetical protein